MGKRIVLIQGHPDPVGGHFGQALAAAYRQGAEQAGHEVRLIEVAALDVPMVRSKAQWDGGELIPALDQAQQTLAWGEHWVLFYPLWLGTMPALLKAFLEQVLRPGFAVSRSGDALAWHKQLRGRSARIVVTMGMPAMVYRWYFRAHSVKSLERNILGFCGIAPIRETLIGMVEAAGDARRRQWLARMRALGARAR